MWSTQLVDFFFAHVYIYKERHIVLASVRSRRLYAQRGAKYTLSAGPRYADVSFKENTWREGKKFEK